MRATLFILVFATTAAISQAPPALSSIKLEDLKKDMEELTGDHFRGREGATLDELKVSAWIANRFKDLGMKPAGDDGTYFQFFPVMRQRPSMSSRININDKSLKLWSDVLVAQMPTVTSVAPIVYLGPAEKIDMATVNVKGKAVALDASSVGIDLNISLPHWRYTGLMMTKYGDELIKKGAFAILFVADKKAEEGWAESAENMRRGIYGVEGMPAPYSGINTMVPVLWVHQSAVPLFKDKQAILAVDIMIERFESPSVNVIGLIDGTDKNLSKEYVIFSGHQDGLGIRNKVDNDSIYNGADDNGSVDVAMMAIARAFRKNPARRSALFIFHGAEEKRMLGSRWYASHPTVPKDNIVAVLNGDMIGRNNPDSAALLGVRPPHRNSSELVNMALAANKEGPAFKLDTLWDKVEHKELWYFRSDHLPYARAGIPALMYTTLLHDNYHTPVDDAAHIDYSKLKKMTEWIYRTAWKVANADKRPAVDPNFKLERAN